MTAQEITADKLHELIAWVERSTGPDRELDAALHTNLADIAAAFEFQFDGSAIARNETSDGIGLVRFASPGGWEEVPRYTASVDAALAFSERLLPGYRFSLFTDGEGKGPMCLALLDDDPVKAEGRAPTLPLAIILATLKAKLALVENEHGE